MELTLPTNRFTQSLAMGALRLKSWRLEVNMPAAPKFVLVGAPHTSKLDLYYALMLAHGTSIKMHWIGKDSLFRWPVGGALRWMGGIPVKRNSSQNFVNQIVDVFNRLEKLVVAIAPEGTRGRAEYWKTGFYYIALGAGVPIALGFVDYKDKVVGIGPTIYPSGDIQADFVQIKAFYENKTGRHPELQGETRIREY
jgi:1-acyl-sn-glycerol-3-phosphate acyltransferase